LVISLDFDQTYTRDPELWNEFIGSARKRGYTVYIVTMRYDMPKEADEVRTLLSDKVDGIYFTGRKAKEKFMFDKGIDVSVWVDDMPFFILHDAASR
jgi:DNA-binding LacI/PurR family transcriptional regulator